LSELALTTKYNFIQIEIKNKDIAKTENSSFRLKNLFPVWLKLKLFNKFKLQKLFKNKKAEMIYTGFFAATFNQQ